MAQTAQRSQIPVPSAVPAVDSASAFPPIPSSHPPAAAASAPAPSARPESTSSIPSYARASKAFLPEVPKSSPLAKIHPSSVGPSSPYSRPSEPAPAKETAKASTKNKRMSLPVGAGAAHGGQGKKKGAGKGAAAGQQQGAPKGNGHRRAESEGQYALDKKAAAQLARPLSPRSSPLSATAPTFTFRPTAAPFVPPSATPAPAPTVAAHPDHLSPLAPTFQPHSPVSDSAEIAVDDAPAAPLQKEDMKGLGLEVPPSGAVEDKETPPSPSFKEMALEAEDEAREEGEGDLTKESEPRLAVAQEDEGKKLEAEEEMKKAEEKVEEKEIDVTAEETEPKVEAPPAVEAEVSAQAERKDDTVSNLVEEPRAPSPTPKEEQVEQVAEVTETTPLPEPLVHALANKAEDAEKSAAKESSASHPVPTEDAPLPEPLLHALANKAEGAEDSAAEEVSASHPVPTEDAPLPEPLVRATLNADDSSSSELSSPEDVPTTLEAALPTISAQSPPLTAVDEPSEDLELVRESEPLGDDDIPISAEEVIALPRLDDVLDVDELETPAPTASEPIDEDKTAEEEERREQIVEKSVSLGSAEDEAQQVEQEASENAREVQEVVAEKVEQASEKIGEDVEVAEEKFEPVKESLAHGVEVVEEKAVEVGEQIKESAEAAVEKVREGVAEVEERVEPVVVEAKERIEAGAEQVKESVEAGWAQAKEATAAGVDNVKDGAAYLADRVEDAYSTVKDKVESTVDSIKDAAASEDPVALEKAEEQRQEAVAEQQTSIPTPSRSNSTDWEPFEAEDAEGASTPTSARVPSTSNEQTPSQPSRFKSSTSSDFFAPPTGLSRRSSSPPPPARDPTRDPNSDEAPSLTLAIVSAWRTASWAKKIPAILASIAINFGLPFVNGVMLGFGELFARNYIGVRLGWGNPFRAPSASGQRANTASVGLRGGARDHPLQGSAGVRTTVEAVESEAFAAAGAAAAQAERG